MPYVESALELAVDGLESLEVRFHQPKVATVYLTGVSYPNQGEASDATYFDLNFSYKDVKRKKIGRPGVQESFFGTAFHEIIHCIRSEYFDEDTVPEIVASEGLAYVGTELYMQRLIGGPLNDRIPMPFEDLDTPFARQLDDDFKDSMDYYGASDDERFFGEWIGEDNYYAVIHGAYSVARVIKNGATLDEVMAIPAAKILRLK